MTNADRLVEKYGATAAMVKITNAVLGKSVSCNFCAIKDTCFDGQYAFTFHLPSGEGTVVQKKTCLKHIQKWLKEEADD